MEWIFLVRSGPESSNTVNEGGWSTHMTVVIVDCTRALHYSATVESAFQTTSNLVTPQLGVLHSNSVLFRLPSAYLGIPCWTLLTFKIVIISRPTATDTPTWTDSMPSKATRNRTRGIYRYLLPSDLPSSTMEKIVRINVSFVCEMSNNFYRKPYVARTTRFASSQILHQTMRPV